MGIRGVIQIGQCHYLGYFFHGFFPLVELDWEESAPLYTLISVHNALCIMRTMIKHNIDNETPFHAQLEIYAPSAHKVSP